MNSAIQSDAVYRKYHPNLGWSDFIEDGNNAIYSALSSPMGCPAPGDNAYVDGLVPGHQCIQLSIEDGGPNDSDGVANSIIKDPGGVAQIIHPEPNVSVTKMTLSNTVFQQAGGEQVVLQFNVNNDSSDVAIHSLTITSSGTANESTDIAEVSLYRDDDKDLFPDLNELIVTDSYSSDDGSITFTFSAPYQLPIGEARFLVTYNF